MNDVLIVRRAALIAVLWLLSSAASAAAQGDPLSDLDEVAPDAGAVPIDEPVEDQIGADGGVPIESEEVTATEPASGDDMVVTGSRIRRSNFAAPAAVQIMDSKQLAASGAQNMTDVVKNMNINSGSDLNADVSTASAGSAQFNLRGLGPSSTLVLLNGRRLPLSAAASPDGSGFVDINTVPLGFIERIEVLKGGASAIYGSDAVAGVVNIITRKRMDGFEAHAGAQATDSFDQHEWDVSLLGGAQGERTRVLGGISYFKREPLSAEDRAFTDNGRNVSQFGWPSAFLQYGEDGAPRMMPNPTPGGPDLPVSFRDPGCGTVPRSAPVQGQALNFCSFDFNDYFMLMIDEERTNVYSSLEHDVSNHTMAFIEASYARSRASRTLSPSYPLLLPVFVPADHRDNPTGDRLRWYGRVAGGNSPPYETEYDSDTLHTVAGIGGDFGGISESAEEWEWELAGTWSGNRYQVFAQDVLTANLQQALNSCGPDDDPSGCWNPFSFGMPNSEQLIDRVHGELRTKADTTLTTVSADLTGPVLELPGGDLSVAVGGQLRMETARSDADHDSNQEAFVFLVGGPDWQSDRRILAAYGELLLPFFRGFELQAAGRVESYDDVGTSANPMLGVSWTPATTVAGAEASPVSKVRLRGTYSTAFRAPSLLQGNGAITELSEIFNVTNNAGTPMRSPLGIYTAVRTFGSDDLTPQKSMTITGGLEWAPTTSLLIEGDYWRYSYEDIIVKENAQAKVAADFATMSDPDITRDPVAGIPTRINVRFVNAEEVLTHGIDLGATFRSDFGARAGTFSVGANASYVLAYEIPQSSVPSPLWNESITSCDQPSAMPGTARAGSSCDVAGLRNISTFARSLPRLRASIPLGWSLDGHNAAINTNLIGSYRDDGDSDPTAGEDYRAIDAQVTFDLQYAYRWQADEHLATTFKLGVINALDSDPPAVNTGYGYDVSTHDPRGRLIYVRLIQEL